MRVILQLVLADIVRAMFASPITCLKIGEAMNTGKIILVDASKAKLGDDGSELYQRFFSSYFNSQPNLRTDGTADMRQKRSWR